MSSDYLVSIIVEYLCFFFDKEETHNTLLSMFQDGKAM